MTPIAWVRWAFRGALLLVALGVLYVAVTFAQVWWASNQDEATAADAIVVLGAAQWDGRPSPVLQARLDHAAELWQEGLAPVIIVTGGKQEGDRFTQGFTGYDYLTDLGVPDAALRVEVDGTDTFTELSASSVILANEDLGDEVLLVTDPYHAFRSAAVAREVGLSPHVSPTTTGSDLDDLARETAAVALGRIVTFRRLSNWS